MRAYVYVYAYVYCMCVYVCMSVLHVCACVYVCAYVCTLSACVYLCAYMCTCVCICVYMCVCIHTHILKSLASAASHCVVTSHELSIVCFISPEEILVYKLYVVQVILFFPL